MFEQERLWIKCSAVIFVLFYFETNSDSALPSLQNDVNLPIVKLCARDAYFQFIKKAQALKLLNSEINSDSASLNSMQK